MNAPVISIVIATYNRADLVKQCLDRLFALAPDEPPFELIVVDNASTDGTVELLETYPQPFVLLRNTENRNFAGANNQGAAVALGKYLVMLNSDTMPEAGWLREMLRVIEAHPDCGIVGCKLLYPHNRTIQHAGVAFYRGGHPFHIYHDFAENAEQVSYEREFKAVTAACWMVPRELYLDLGGFDERFRNGFEDVDFCRKVTETGKRILYTPRATVLHFEESSPGRRNHNRENWQLLKQKWKDRTLDDCQLKFAEDGIRAIEVEEYKLRLFTAERVSQIAIEKTRQLLFQFKFSEAEFAIQELLRKYPNNEGVYELLVQTAVEQCDLPRAAQAAEALYQKFPSFRNGCQAALLTKRSNQLDHCSLITKSLTQFAESDIEKAMVNVLHGDIAVKQNRLDDAEMLYRTAQQIAGALEEIDIGLANVLMMRGDANAAELAYLGVIEKNSRSQRAHLGLAICLQTRNDWEKALEAYQDSLDLEQADWQAMLALVNCAQQVKRFDIAEECLQNFLRRQPNHPDLLILLAGTKIASGNADEAVPHLLAVLHKRPGDAMATKLLAMAS
ncbi:MAG: glycosyltransferase [bacterium]|nr:glycosyltransferase [bacterium]